MPSRRDLVTRRELLERTLGTAAAPRPNEVEIVNEVIRDLSYDWRELDPEETLRFFALRLADAKLIKSSSREVIDRGSDFAYMRQLRSELKP